MIELNPESGLFGLREREQEKRSKRKLSTKSYLDDESTDVVSGAL
jgi:hypothetical protein